MACINIFNSEHQGLCGAPPPMSTPRISFSNDFVIGTSAGAVVGGAAAAPPDPNFEFSSMGSRPMMSADELFFKGRMVPLREGGGTTTLRDELRASDGGDHDTWDGARNPRGSAIRWREFLGLRKPHCKKTEKVDGSDVLDAINESKSTSEIELVLHPRCPCHPR